MIAFYRKADCRYCDEVEAHLNDLVVARRVITVSEPGALDVEGVSPEELPVLREGRRLYRGRQEIQAFLAELTRELRIGRQFQSDACYLNPDDPATCL